MDRFTETLQEMMLSCQRLKQLKPTRCRETEFIVSLIEILIQRISHVTSSQNSVNEKTKSTSVFNKTYPNNTLSAYEEWITVTRASEIMNLCKGRITRLANQEEITTNKKKGKKRKLLKSSVLLYKQILEEKEDAKARKREDEFVRKKIERNIPDRH